MCSPTAVMAATTVVSTVYTMQSQRSQARYQSGVDKYNARVAENKAQEVRKAGNEAENIQRRKAAELLSKQRVQLGAAGVDIGSGSALQLQEDTITLGEADALRIRSNTGSQVQSLLDQSSMLEDRSEAWSDIGNNQATGTILSGVGNVIGSGVADKWFTPNSAANQIQSQTGFTGGAPGVLSGDEFTAFQ